MVFKRWAVHIQRQLTGENQGTNVYNGFIYFGNHQHILTDGYQVRKVSVITRGQMFEFHICFSHFSQMAMRYHSPLYQVRLRVVLRLFKFNHPGCWSLDSSSKLWILRRYPLPTQSDFK